MCRSDIEKVRELVRERGDSLFEAWSYAAFEDDRTRFSHHLEAVADVEDLIDGYLRNIDEI